MPPRKTVANHYSKHTEILPNNISGKIFIDASERVHLFSLSHKRRPFLCYVYRMIYAAIATAPGLHHYIRPSDLLYVCPREKRRDHHNGIVKRTSAPISRSADGKRELRPWKLPTRYKEIGCAHIRRSC